MLQQDDNKIYRGNMPQGNQIYNGVEKPSRLELRRLVVDKILKISPDSCTITRQVQFLAVSIFDSYIEEQAKGDSTGREQIFTLSEVTSLSITCLKLAQKLEGDTRLRIRGFQELFGWDGTYEDLKEECAIIESKLCSKIDFFLPLETAIDFLDKAMNVHPTQSRNQICKVLRLLLIGISYSMELSQKPKYGSRIYEHIVFRKKDPQIEQYVKRVVSWYRAKTSNP